MLRNTFHHIPGIGKKSEEELWARGVCTWDDLLKSRITHYSPAKTNRLFQHIRDSDSRYKNGADPKYFSERLPSKLHWRFFPEFMHSVAYLDIETTGLDEYGAEITTIAIYDGNAIYHYTNGINLNDFQNDIFNYKLLVTYNGKSFDIPFIERYFKTKLDHAHIDLRHVLASLGFKGGLKGCEAALGIDRKELTGIDGYFAVLLWNDYIKNNNPKALETLLAYNIEDVINLEYLMTTAYNLKLKETPFYPTLKLEQQLPPENPLRPDMLTVKRIKSRYMMYG